MYHLFVAMKGTQVDGHKFIPKAIELGAKSVLCEDIQKIAEASQTGPATVIIKGIGTGAHPGICHRLFPWTMRICAGSGGGTAMSITAYKIEAVGHDRTGKDFGYVNIMTASIMSRLRKLPNHWISKSA